MGFIDTTTSPKIPVFFNVVHAVGKNCPNVRDDVKLIQYLLISFYEKSQFAKPFGDIAVTGVCDSATMNWILKFQLDVNKIFPGAVAADNRIDRVRNHSTTGSITNTYYTLLVLNDWTSKLNPDAYIATPAIVQLENLMNVPPPSWDVVNNEPIGRMVGGG